MPFSATSETHTEKYWTDFFNVIKREIERQGFICVRSETGPHNMIKYIIEKISSSDIVIAVLTDMNPNVWYELGIRHSLRNGTLMLIEKGQKIPFDISSYGLVMYPDGIALATTLEKEIQSYLSKLEENKHFDSPVLDCLGLPARQQDKIDEMYELVLKIANEKADNKYADKFKSKSHSNRVLWVDDFPSNNESVIRLFQSKGIRFDIALSTEQGIELYNENIYDLIITDMGRGRESDAGLQLIRQIKQIDNNAPPIAVFASYSALENYGRMAMHLGATAAVNGVGEIVAIISQILDLDK